MTITERKKLEILKPERKIDPDETVMDLHEVANMLKVSPRTVQKWMRRNDFPYYKIGKVLRFLKSEVLEWFKLQGE